MSMQIICGVYKYIQKCHKSSRLECLFEAINVMVFDRIDDISLFYRGEALQTLELRHMDPVTYKNNIKMVTRIKLFFKVALRITHYYIDTG